MFLSSKRIFIFVSIPLISLFALLRIFYRPPKGCVQHIVIERPSLCRTSSTFRCEHCIPNSFLVSSSGTDAEAIPSGNWAFRPDLDARNYGLTDEQCSVAFPGLFEEIEAFVQRRRKDPITKELLARAEQPKATLRVMIYDNELFVINHTVPNRWGVRPLATLQALHRAILTSPKLLPNAEFAITVADFTDDPGRVIWSYTRTADDINTVLIPDFGFWSYGDANTLSALGSWTQVQRRMREIEDQYSSFAQKIPKAFWRGEIALAEDIRTKLLDRTAMQPWADVKQVRLRIRFDNGETSLQDALPIHEYCRYMFLIHTEGNSYSGRLKYLQNCRSVIFAHTIEWIQPFEYLMVSSGPKQNYVEVARDFSDLAEKVEYYLTHLEEAERIANNSIMTFRERYHTPAAEACYWRKLIRGWRDVSFEPEFYDTSKSASKTERRWRGTPFENYALRTRIDFGASAN